jgi:hypothetical protein
MDRMTDTLALALGRRLPAPLRWIVSLVWWITFAVAILSLWPEGHRAVGGLLAEDGITFRPPAQAVAIPALTLLTVVLLAHELMIRRRDILLAARGP